MPSTVSDARRSAGGFRNIAVSNCVFRETWGTGIKLQMVQGARMSGIVFTGLVMREVTGPFSLRLAGWSEGTCVPSSNEHWERGVLERVSFSRITATVAPVSGRRGQRSVGEDRRRPEKIGEEEVP